MIGGVASLSCIGVFGRGVLSEAVLVIGTPRPRVVKCLSPTERKTIREHSYFCHFPEYHPSYFTTIEKEPSANPGFFAFFRGTAFAFAFSCWPTRKWLTTPRGPLQRYRVLVDKAAVSEQFPWRKSVDTTFGS